MAETTTSHEYQNAANLIRVQGILSIVFGGMGIFFGMIAVLLFAFAITDYNSYQVVSAYITAFICFVFAVLPHVYLLIAGIHLLKKPNPTVAKTLIIINLVVGVFYNLVILIIAIINLVQLAEYEHGYKVHRSK